MEKELPQTLATQLTPELAAGRRVRPMFQDETRFGHTVRPRAPALLRPAIDNGPREIEFPVDAVIRRLEHGLPRLATGSTGLCSLAAWPWIIWIIRLNLNAN